MPRSDVGVRLALFGILSLHAILLWDCAGKKYASVDESGHIPAGIAHWLGSDYSQYRVNPPLPRMLATLPLLLTDLDTEGIYPLDAPGARPEWLSAREFADRNAPDTCDSCVWPVSAASAGQSWAGGWCTTGPAPCTALRRRGCWG